jgi:uncharacterized protein
MSECKKKSFRNCSMQYDVHNLKLPLSAVPADRTLSGSAELAVVRQLCAEKLRIAESDIGTIRILRKSVDARNKSEILLVYSAAVEMGGARAAARLESPDIRRTPAVDDPFSLPGAVTYGTENIIHRPVVIGSGPAGLFAGLMLAENGYCPLILERGYDVDRRSRDVAELFQAGVFNPHSNIQFGEGGAGTFSDGKLTTRIKDKRLNIVLQRFIEAGAPAEIAYLHKPHIGTDILKEVVRAIRRKIIGLGGRFDFGARVTDIQIDDGRATGITINDSRRLETKVIIAALGHSARDTYAMLARRGVRMVAKPFAIGVRIEHHQDAINAAQYGKFAGHKALGPADYLLSFRSQTTGRPAYSFCMCPGGMVVAAASEPGMLVVNGMSEYKRNQHNANSALVVAVTPEDFAATNPLGGVEFQRMWEKHAFAAGGGGYNAPAQMLGDFIEARKPHDFGKIKPSYLPGVRPAELANCLPGYVVSTLKEALAVFGRRIKGFDDRQAVLTGVETRTSAPLRIVRNQDMQSENTQNLYPAGEGAGYAGGIVSSAVDGIKSAEQIMRRFRPLH